MIVEGKEVEMKRVFALKSYLAKSCEDVYLKWVLQKNFKGDSMTLRDVGFGVSDNVKLLSRYSGVQIEIVMSFPYYEQSQVVVELQIDH